MVKFQAKSVVGRNDIKIGLGGDYSKNCDCIVTKIGLKTRHG